MALQAKPYLQRIELDYDSVESLEEYPFQIPAIRELYELKFHPDVTFFVGENGTYEDTEHFAITRDFLNNYPQRIEQVLAPDEEA